MNYVQNKNCLEPDFETDTQYISPQPFLKWAGGKRQLLKVIKKIHT